MTTFSRHAWTLAGVVLGLGVVSANAENLVISNWDGYLAPDAIEKFNAATGNTAELVLHATNEEIMGFFSMRLGDAFAFQPCHAAFEQRGAGGALAGLAGPTGP